MGNRCAGKVREVIKMIAICANVSIGLRRNECEVPENLQVKIFLKTSTWFHWNGGGSHRAEWFHHWLTHQLLLHLASTVSDASVFEC